jgi:hypothetical protein
MRRMLVVAGALVLAVGVPLFGFSSKTATGFAWTIQPPLTAAFLGGGYWASVALEWLAARQRLWAHARIAAPAVITFTTLTLIATLIHLSRFHLHNAGVIASMFAWGWLAVYVLVPPIFLVLLARQLRSPGSDPPRTAPLARPVRAGLGAHAALMLPIGAALFVAPGTADVLWPWTLTPLTGRAVGAWLVGIGIAAVHSLREDDWQRVRPAMVAYGLLGSLELIALARYGGFVDWSSVSAYVFLVTIISMPAVAVAAWATSIRATSGR